MNTSEIYRSNRAVGVGLRGSKKQLLSAHSRPASQATLGRSAISYANGPATSASKA